MRYLVTIIVMLGLAAETVLAGDYIRLGVDSIQAGTYDAEIPFYAERTCPYPEKIMGTSNGFVLNATGNVVWEFVDYQEESYLQSWFLLSFLFTNGFDDVSPDTFLTGGASMPPSGMPVFDDRLWFTVWLNVGGVGAICFDSAFVFSAGAWKWSGMQCGLGGAPDKPLFVDKYGSDDEHPICITVYGPPCGDVNCDWSVDVDDIVFLVNYIFGGGPAPVYFEDGDVDCSGQIDIDDVVYLMEYVYGTGPEPCAGCP